MTVFRWPVIWRTRRQVYDNGDGDVVKFSSDQVVFHDATSFYNSVPVDLLNYVSSAFYCNPTWLGRTFNHPWQPIEAMRQPDKRALREWFIPMRDALISKIPPPRRRRRVGAWRDDGNEVSIERLRDGHATFFRSHVSQVREGAQSVALLVDLAIDANVKGKDLYWRGAAVSALADRLEQAGYIVEIWGLTRAGQIGKWKKRDEDPTALIAIELKSGGENMEIASVVNMLSWMPRVIMYPLLVTAPCLRRMYADGMPPSTRCWFWFDVWSLENLNLPENSYLLYGFDSMRASVESMLAVLNDLEHKKGSIR